MREYLKPNSERNKKRLFVLNELSLRLSPALANEIGLNESIMLLQIEYWISIAPDTNIIDGRKWTFQSVRQMQEKAFAFWSISTINRTANNLINRGLIIEGNYNKHSYDKTRWFALNYENLAQLDSIAVGDFADTALCQNETGHDTTLCQNETRSNQNDTGLFQNDTTIPQITPENINTTDTAAVADPKSNESGDFDHVPESKGCSTEVTNGRTHSLGDRAITFAEDNFEYKLKPFEKTKIREWCKEFHTHGSRDPDALVIAGLGRCIMMKNYTLAYLEPIIIDYLKHNVTTVEQIPDLNDRFRKQRKLRKRPETKNESESKSKTVDKYENVYL